MIPSLAHFIWLGKTFPFLYVLGVYSAAKRGGFKRIVLHHNDDISHNDGVALLKDLPQIEFKKLQVDATFAVIPDIGVDLLALYRRLDWPASRANMLRAAILHQNGGVYLDTDTICVKPIAPLLDRAVFCGAEPIALPQSLRQSRNPLLKLKGAALLALREGFRLHPSGWRAFRHVAPLYTQAVNNAVLGAVPRHPFVRGLLERMVRMEPQRQLVRYGLGTNLLQQAVADYRGRDLVVHAPESFYPLGPEISQHWFRIRKQVHLGEWLGAETIIVHWYASVRTKSILPKLDAQTILQAADRQAISALARAVAPELLARSGMTRNKSQSAHMLPNATCERAKRVLN